MQNSMSNPKDVLKLYMIIWLLSLSHSNKTAMSCIAATIEKFCNCEQVFTAA